MKRTLGILFIIIASLIGLVLLVMIPGVFSNITELVTNKSNGYATGQAATGITVFIGLILVAIFFFWLGRKWTKKPQQE